MLYRFHWKWFPWDDIPPTAINMQQQIIPVPDTENSPTSTVPLPELVMPVWAVSEPGFRITFPVAPYLIAMVGVYHHVKLFLRDLSMMWHIYPNSLNLAITLSKFIF